MSGVKTRQATSIDQCYLAPMAAIQVKNVPQELHDKLREISAEEGCSLSELVLRAIDHEIKRHEHTKHLKEVFSHPTGLKSTKRQRRAFIAELRRERDAR